MGDKIRLRIKEISVLVKAQYLEICKYISISPKSRWPHELINHPSVIDFFRERIDHHSKKLAQYETIKKFKLLHKPFTMEGGEITPTLKLKRKQINEKFKALIDSMYQKH